MTGEFSLVSNTTSIGEGASIGHHCVVESDASIGDKTTIGHFAYIGSDVRIGRGCQIGNHVTIHPETVVGDDVRIDDHAVVGKQPMRSPNSAVTRDQRHGPAMIGSRVLIGTGVVLYAGCTLGDGVLVADLATVREEVTIGDFTIVGRGASVENKCRIGRYCKLETNVYVAAYSVIEDRAFLAPGVLTSNDNYLGRTEERFKHFAGPTIRRGARLGVGAVVLPGKEIGPDAVLAAGAVQTRDADAKTIYAGVPASKFRSVPEEQLLDNQGWDDV